MLEIVGRLGVRLGAILLLLTVLARFTDLTRASRIVDGFAMILSAIVVLIGVGCLAVARRTGSIAPDGPGAAGDGGESDERADRDPAGGFSRRAAGGAFAPGHNPGLRVLLREGAAPAATRGRAGRRARRPPARAPERSSGAAAGAERRRESGAVGGPRAPQRAPVEDAGRGPRAGGTGRAARKDGSEVD